MSTSKTSSPQQMSPKEAVEWLVADGMPREEAMRRVTQALDQQQAQSSQGPSFPGEGNPTRPAAPSRPDPIGPMPSMPRQGPSEARGPMPSMPRTQARGDGGGSKRPTGASAASRKSKSRNKRSHDDEGGIKGLLAGLFVSRKRLFIAPLLFAALIATLYFATSVFAPPLHAAWVAPFLKPVIFAAVVLYLIIVFRPLERGWADDFGRRLGTRPRNWLDRFTFAPVRRGFGKLCRGLASFPMRILYVIILGAAAWGSMFGVPSFVAGPAQSITNGLSNVPFLNAAASGNSVEVQPVVGNFKCASGKTVTANSGGTFNGVPYMVGATNDKLGITFSGTPKNLSGFVTPGRVVLLSRADAGNKTFVFTRENFGGKLPTSLGICSTK